MAKFITGKDLENAVYDVIWNAKSTLIIVSPYVKLDDYFKKLFDHHQNNPDLHIVLVFGKNEQSVSKSLSKKDIDYFKNFLNISIVYVPNLHGKYYANESMGILTSINLYDYSFKNNIEFGICSKTNILSNISGSADNDAFNTCMDMAHEHDVVFIKRPVMQKSMLSSLLGKKYIKSDILFDNTNNLYTSFKSKQNTSKRLSDFPDELELGTENTSRPEREIENKEIEKKMSEQGYCIRTGQKIMYNIKSPYSIESWKSWSAYSNVDFPEKYCHKTGELSKGKTSMRKPVL